MTARAALHSIGSCGAENVTTKLNSGADRVLEREREPTVKPAIVDVRPVVTVAVAEPARALTVRKCGSCLSVRRERVDAVADTPVVRGWVPVAVVNEEGIVVDSVLLAEVGKTRATWGLAIGTSASRLPRSGKVLLGEAGTKVWRR